jgi:hypothetical protein
LNPFLFQRITVSGWTTIKAFLQLFHLFDRITQNIRSRVRSLGRFIVYWYIESCWRRARFSRIRSDCFLNSPNRPKNILIICFNEPVIMVNLIDTENKKCQWFQLEQNFCEGHRRWTPMFGQPDRYDKLWAAG